jgi:hypothetical protein
LQENNVRLFNKNIIFAKKNQNCEKFDNFETLAKSKNTEKILCLPLRHDARRIEPAGSFYLVFLCKHPAALFAMIGFLPGVRALMVTLLLTAHESFGAESAPKPDPKPCQLLFLQFYFHFLS